MIIRDYLICLLQMYLLEDLEKNILPYRRERFWEKFLVYCIAALAMFGTNRLESSILNMVMIPVIYMIASMVVFRGNIWKKLVTVCCYYVLAIIPEFLFAALTNAYGVTGASEGFRTETEKTLALLLMSTMTFLFIKCINQVTRKRDYLTIENKTFTVLLMLPTATIVMLGCMFYSHTSFEGMNRVMVPVGASLLLMTNIFIFTVFDRFVEKSEEVKKMDRLYQKSRAEIANLQYMNTVVYIFGDNENEIRDVLIEKLSASNISCKRVGGQEIIERCHEDINVKKKYIIAFSEMASLCITKASELLGENIIINRIFLINPSKAKESDLYLGDISIIDGNSVAIKSWEKAVLGNVREFESNSNDIFDIIMRELENDK